MQVLLTQSTLARVPWQSLSQRCSWTSQSEGVTQHSFPLQQMPPPQPVWHCWSLVHGMPSRFFATQRLFSQ